MKLKFKNWLKRKSLASFVFLTVYLLGLAAVSFQAKNYYSSVDSFVGRHTYDRVDNWIEVSRCSLETGIYLALCPNEIQPVPIERWGTFDDRGHALMGNIFSTLSGRPINRHDYTRINILLNLIVIVGISFLVYRFWSPAVASLVLLPSYYLASTDLFLSPDSDGINISAFILSFLPSIGLVLSKFNPNAKLFVGSAFIVALISILREPYAIGGALTLLMITAMALIKFWKNRIQLVKLTSFFAVMIFVWQITTPTLLKSRELIWGLEVDHSMEAGRSVSHDFIAGLGYRGNKWGLTYWDLDVLNYVVPEDDGVNKGFTRNYSSLAWSKYFELVFSDPIAVIELYFIKYKDSLKVAFDLNKSGLFKYGLGLAILLALFLVLVGLLRGTNIQGLTLLLVLFLCTQSVLFQGVISAPVHKFIYPSFFGILLFSFFAVYLFFRQINWAKLAPGMAHQPWTRKLD